MNKYEYLELYINKNWISINDILNNNKEIYNISLNNIKIYKNMLIYTIFQICNFYSLKYEELEIRQKVKIITKGEKDFNLNVNAGSVKKFKGQNCKCILCHKDFKAIRRNIKICNNEHYCKVFCLYSGEMYEKQIMKWNKIEWIGNQAYLYGKCFKDKSSQVSANNVMTIFNGTNNICNLTYEDRSAISNRQKENGTFAFWNYTYDERSKRSKELAKKRMKEGTHNWLWWNKTEEARKLSIENSVKTKKENGIYEKMALNRISDTANFIKTNCKNIKFNGKQICYYSFALYDNIPGVWSLWGVNKNTGNFECLTLGQTTDLNKELQWTLRVLANDKLQELESEAPGCTGRWNIIQKDYINYKYELVSVNEKDKNLREIIEAVEAINNNALYWLPSLTQQSNDFKEKLINWINS